MRATAVHLARKRIALLLLAGAGMAAATAHAGSCSVSASPMAFPNYQAVSFPGKLSSTDKSSDATVVLNCVGVATGGSYSIALGADAQGSRNPRRMAGPSPAAGMVFNIYRDAAYSMVWGDGAVEGLLQGSLATGDSRTEHRVYGRIPGGQWTLPAGSYSVTLGVTLTYEP